MTVGAASGRIAIFSMNLASAIQQKPSTTAKKKFGASQNG
jgi:hypothetical protein